MGAFANHRGEEAPQSSIRELEIQESHRCDSVLTHRPEKGGSWYCCESQSPRFCRLERTDPILCPLALASPWGLSDPHSHW